MTHDAQYTHAVHNCRPSVRLWVTDGLTDDSILPRADHSACSRPTLFHNVIQRRYGRTSSSKFRLWITRWWAYCIIPPISWGRMSVQIFCTVNKVQYYYSNRSYDFSDHEVDFKRFNTDFPDSGLRQDCCCRCCKTSKFARSTKIAQCFAITEVLGLRPRPGLRL